MCWIGKDDRKIAKKDIPVFKIVYKNPEVGLVSCYRYFRYKVGSIYSSRIKKKSMVSHVCITNGLHSFSNSCKIIEDERESIDINYKTLALDVYDKDGKLKLYKLKCVIPKRSAYYENNRGELVSSRLKILKAIKL